MKNMKQFLAILLVIVMMLSILVSCKDTTEATGESETDSAETQTSGDNSTVTYTVEVKTLGGMKMEGVLCYIKGKDDNTVAIEETDENGIARVKLPRSSDYYVVLNGVPNGYILQPRYDLTSTGISITLVSKVIEDTNIAGVTYKPGDVMHDFTVTTIKGETLTLSKLLEEKKMVLINFWFSTCGPCASEIPYMNSAYNKYKDDIEIVALNDFAGDSLQDVLNYTLYDDNGEEYQPDFPMVKDNNGLSLTKNFNGEGYPTNVIIDRYGVICAIESGAISSEKVFTNAFDYFIADNYQQKLVETLYAFTPIDEVDVEMPSSEEISAVLDGGKLNVDYHAEEGNEYSWPFIIGEKDGVSCIHPSNIDKDNSFAILYAEVELKADEALIFDYFSSTEADNDVFYVIVNGKDIYSLSGISEDWENCCAYVAQETATYQVAFCYRKDEGKSSGDDTVYLKNLRVVDKSEVPTQAYIFRFAATKPTPDGIGYTDYANVVYNEADGYYHVNSEDGPILLVNLLYYSQFDSNKTVFERLYGLETEIFEVNGENRFDRFEKYGTLSANSIIHGYCSVTKELKEYLEVYTQMFRRDVGKADSENLWLQLCAYYDAYGPDNEQLEDPIKGLAPFSAYEAKLGAYNTVTYTRALIPRGLLYRFVPEVSGVYRVTSHSTDVVDGAIFVLDRDVLYFASEPSITTNENFERFCPDLTFENPDGTFYRDMNNCSLVAYMEAGKEYYIDICYEDIYNFNSFTFEVSYVGERFDQFCAASPGPFTYELEPNGQFGSTIAGGIDVVLCDDGYYHEKRKDGSVGEVIYADFRMTTDVFTDRTLLEMIEWTSMDGIVYHAFDFGNGLDYTEKMKEYAAQILEEEDFPERRGCVPVDEELAIILQKLMDTYVFENVEHSWTKLCYYYIMHGSFAE